MHPVKQIYHCFGCGVGGDVFKFVMEMDKITFPEAVRAVAEKCGIAVPRARERTPEERNENQQRTSLVEMHREAAAFFAQQLNGTPEGRAAKAYLLDRGLDSEAMARFGIGFAPSGGEALLRAMKQKYPEKVLEASGLFSRDQNGRLFDRFRRRVMFPIANESGKIVAFGGRALGDDLPKYLNSPETPIYSKSNVLYHLDRAKEALRQRDFAVLVEGYMDAIAVARAGISNVVASCGTSLTEPQVKLLNRFTRRIIVNYDPDTAGPGRDRALACDPARAGRRSARPRAARRQGPGQLHSRRRRRGLHEIAERSPALRRLFDFARPQDGHDHGGRKTARREFSDALRAAHSGPHSALGMGHAHRAAAAHRGAGAARIDAQGRQRAPQRSEGPPGTRGPRGETRRAAPGADADRSRGIPRRSSRRRFAPRNCTGAWKPSAFSPRWWRPANRASARMRPRWPLALEDRDRRLLFEIAFESAAPPTWEEAESCLAVLRRRRAEEELAAVQKQIESLQRPPERARAANCGAFWSASRNCGGGWILRRSSFQ